MHQYKRYRKDNKRHLGSVRFQPSAERRQPKLPEGSKEDGEPEKYNFPRILYIGKNRLGYTEPEIWRMTPRKFFAIYNEYLMMNGYVKPAREMTIDDLP